MAKKIAIPSKSYKTALPEFSNAMHELGRSSAASKHDNRPRKHRTRKDIKKAAIRDSRY